MGKSSTWLKPNRRVLGGALVMLAAAASALAALALAARSSGWPVWMVAALAIASSIGWLGVLMVLWQWRTPRVAYCHGELLLSLGKSEPVRLPVDAVECFLLGQGPTLFPSDKGPSRTTNLTVRLCEKYQPTEPPPVHRMVGSWCGNQITVRGTWCEPLSIPLVYELNERLAAAQREQCARQAAV